MRIKKTIFGNRWIKLIDRVNAEFKENTFYEKKTTML